MSGPVGRRRGRGEGSIYKDEAHGYWVGAVDLGYDRAGKRHRRKVTGRTRADVARKLRQLREDVESGIKADATYTVERATDDWLAETLDGLAPKTVRLYTDLLRPVRESIGGIPLRKLTSHDVRRVLVELAGDHSTRTLRLTRNVLERAIRHAEANDHVGRNVAANAAVPRGQAGRPSKALTAEQAAAVLKAAQDSRIYAYVVLALTTGARTEELRALRWDHVDLDGDLDAVPPVPPHVDVWRSVRASADTKTRGSRRTLALPQAACEALSGQRERQEADRDKAGAAWQESGLVFTSGTGTALDASHVRRSFRAITKAAGLREDWAPRELRHSFVSLMSEAGVPVEEIARLAGHTDSRTTEVIYRRELRPVMTRGAEVMDTLFKAD
jgi:integrase